LSTRKGVSEGLILDLSSAESTTAVKATGPNIAAERLTTTSLYGGLTYFAIVQKSSFGTRQQLSDPLTVHDIRITLPSVVDTLQPRERQDDVVAKLESAMF